MNAMRRSGYAMVFLGALNVAIELLRWFHLHRVNHVGWFMILFCFGMGSYFIWKGWSDDGPV